MKSLKIIVLLVIFLFIAAVIIRNSNGSEYNYIEDEISSVYSEENKEAQANVIAPVVKDNTKEFCFNEKSKYNSVKNNS